MGGCETMMPESGKDEDLIAAARHIVRALGSNKNLTKDMRKVLADLGSQLSSMAIIDENNGKEINETEERLNTIQEKIMNWEAAQSMIWDAGLEEAYDYLNAVDEARKLIESLESSCSNIDDAEKEFLRRAHDVLQTAMARLEEEFQHMLVQKRQPFEPEHMSFRSSEEDVVVELGSINSFSNEFVEESLHRDSISRTSEEYIVDLVHPDVIPDLRCIANLMFFSNYDQECTQAYINVRKDALDECLSNLEIEKLSIEDVLKLEWGSLNSKIKRWIWVMKIFVRVYLASEKWLSDQIFGELGSVALACFIDASKASILQLLNFGEAISIGPRQPEKLFRILDMYEVLADLLPDIEALFTDEAGLAVLDEYQETLRRLGDYVRAIFLEFKNAIKSNTSSTPFAGGGVHPLTKYVMNYIKALTDNSETLNLLLRDPDEEDSVLLSPDMSPAAEGENVSGDTSSGNFLPIVLHFHSVTSILESNLQDRSKLYKDASLRHLFLVNNIHYMAQKVKNSELKDVLGEKWIRKHNWKFQQQAMEYQRATWGSILSLLKDDGNSSSSSSTSRTLTKERLRSFYLGFEEVYKTQTAWVVSDSQLREDLRISTSLKVIQAFRAFVGGRNNQHLSDKHIKYSADDLQNYLLDLFEGSPRSLHNPHRR